MAKEKFEFNELNGFKACVTTLAVAFTLATCYLGKKAVECAPKEGSMNMNTVFAGYAAVFAASCFAMRTHMKNSLKNPPKIQPLKLVDTSDGEIKVNPKYIKVICKD